VAVIAGSMTDMHDNAIPFGKNAKEMVMEFCEKLKKPLIWGIPAGHTAENITLKLGLDITFDGSTLKQN
jgi:muramoyltetrapeptide carboxypeptidase